MSAIEVPRPEWMDEDLILLEAVTRRFLEQEIAPDYEDFVANGCVSREAWEKTGAAGLLCAGIDEAYGGAGGTFAHDAVIAHVMGEIGLNHFGVALHSTIVAPYIAHYGSEDQKKCWLPKFVSGEYIGAIAMTEPAAGSVIAMACAPPR